MNEYSQYLGPIAIGVLALYLFLGRKKKKPAEPGAVTPTPTPTKIDHSKVEVIIEANEPRMMSVIYHDGLIGGGTYNDNKQNYVYWEDGRKVAVGGASEAVYRMSSIDGAPIANLEKEPNTHNAVTGEISSRRHYDMVTDTIRVGTKPNGDALFGSVSATRFGGNLGFRVHDRNLVRVATGNWYCRGAIKKWGKIMFGAFNYDTEEGGLFVSTDNGMSFSWYSLFKSDNFRPMHMADFGDRVAIAFSKYKDDERQGGGLLFLDKSLEYKTDKFSNEHGGWFDVVSDGKRIYTSALEWKGNKPGAIWCREPDGRWNKIYQTDGPGEVLGLALTDYGTLGAAIREHNRGKVVEIGDRSKKPKPVNPAPTDRTPMPADVRYKVRAEIDGVRKGNLVILVPPHYSPTNITMGVGTPKEQKGVYDGRYHDGRFVYRFRNPGYYWDSPCPIDVGPNKWVIENTAWDSRHGLDYVSQ